MKNRSVNKKVTPKTLVVGIDIAKQTHWVQMMYEGELIGKAFSIHNSKAGFENLVEVIRSLSHQLGAHSVVVGMEPTGHYFKPLAYYLDGKQICKVVLVNPYHVNRSKELDDNSPSKNDRKDARLIAKLIGQGNYFEAHLSKGNWAELRTSNVTRMQLTKKRWQLKSQIITILDQYFPEFSDVFKNLLGKGARFILTHYPFPNDILSVSEQTLCNGLKAATNNRVGQKRTQQIREAALTSIGVKEGANGAKEQLLQLVEEIDLIQKQLERTEVLLAEKLEETGLGKYLTSIPGVGTVSAAAFIAEIGDPDGYESYKQIQKKAGLNLKENSSGKHKGKTTISKRGRPTLRQLGYQIAFVAVAKNPEMKELYQHLITRLNNPLARKQALIAIAIKLMKIMLAVCKKQEMYDPSKVGNNQAAISIAA